MTTYMQHFDARQPRQVCLCLTSLDVRPSALRRGQVGKNGWSKPDADHDPTSLVQRSSKRWTRYADPGQMLIVDASALFEVVADTQLAEQIRLRMDEDVERAAPQVIDVEVLAVIRREHLRGLLDRTKAYLAVQNLRDSPIQRFGHRFLLERAWELRDNVRGWDAFYVALAESFDATLLTLDGRLTRAPGIRCAVEVLS